MTSEAPNIPLWISLLGTPDEPGYVVYGLRGEHVQILKVGRVSDLDLEHHDACGCERCHPESHGFAGDPNVTQDDE